jgi:hypothetical protein
MELITRLFFGTVSRVMLAVLSADILYLYYAGGWQEPSSLIRVSELAILYLLMVISIIWSIIYFRRCISNKKGY